MGDHLIEGIQMTRTALIISNNRKMKENLNGYFTNKQFQIKALSSSQDAISASIEDGTDVCIYDLDRSIDRHLNTIKIIQQLKPNLPIVVLSNDNSFEHLQKIAQMKVFYCAMKPIQWGELDSVVDSIERAQSLYNKKIVNQI
jgi:DNA-binding NtrC family response regulator